VAAFQKRKIPITAPPPVCVPDIIGALAVWIQNKETRKKKQLYKQTNKNDGVPSRSTLQTPGLGYIAQMYV